MKNEYGIDTNILIYYLTGKPEGKHKECLELIKKAEKDKITLMLTSVIFWEATWILEKIYKNSKEKIADILRNFLELEGINCKNKKTLIKAFNLWEKENIDFADAYIICVYKNLNINDIYSYDKHMDNNDINCLNPGGK